MEPYGNPSRLAISSTNEEGDESAEQTGTETLNEQTYFVSQLNLSCNHNECKAYFEMPEYVTDIYLQALDGGDESNAALRQISGVYGSKGPTGEEAETDVNFNHNVQLNVNPEPKPNEGCGCTASYNGGAGAGSAECSGCCCEKPYEPGFTDKKRDPACCGCQDDTYQKGLANKKPCCEWTTEYKYVAEMPAAPPYCAASDVTCCDPCPPKCHEHHGHHGHHQGCGHDDTYQKDLCNKKPECTADYKYVPQLPPPDPYCKKGDSSCCLNCYGPPDTYELIRNTDAQRYRGKGPDRSNFYADESCGCHHKHSGSCNNNHGIMGMSKELDWAELRKAKYSIVPSHCNNSPSLSKRPEFGWMDELSSGPTLTSTRSKRDVNGVPSPTRYPSLFPQDISPSASPDRPSMLDERRPARLTRGETGKDEEEGEEKTQSSGRCIIQ